MLTRLKDQPADKILALMAMYREDPRQGKVDLGVGVYKAADGQTPIMRAIKAAEKQLWEAETTKSYVALAGDPGYADVMRTLILADSVVDDRVAAAATPGGTGAVRQAFELFQMADSGGTIWVSDPTWPNHLSILRHLGIAFKTYRYFDPATRAVRFDDMVEDLAAAKAGDLVLLHGCCHNPTGANLTNDQWRVVAELLGKAGITPMIDIAYQGFGDGLEPDAFGTRLLASELPEMLIAASCSKNFGIYRERTGILMAVVDKPDRKKTAQGNLAHLNRQNFSFPPDHGARLVTMILNDADLRKMWESELEEMRTSMLSLRETLASELRQRTNSDKFDFLAHHRGMFSLLGATPDQVEMMRNENGIYMVGDSRVNIAGLTPTNVPILAEAIVAAGV